MFLRKLHKWLSLAIGIQVFLWVLSGCLISLFDAQTAGGRLTRQAIPEGSALAEFGPLVGLGNLPLARKDVRSIALEPFFNQPVYRVALADSKLLFDARTGRELIIDKPMAQRIALASYRGEGQLLDTQKLPQGSAEMRGVSGALWRSDFSDSLATRVYVSAQDGRVLAHRNNRWALVDFLLMLHFMDYERADSFNNPQIIIVTFATLWLTVSGFLLLFYSFSRRDFRWLQKLRR
ncbi:MAG: Na+-transporting NADH:ubiquinone oxidoreductase subunit F [Halioglobus sp.]|jgi:Na+-transporting NADH:ubiquinone oxidoreductase subunit F